MEKEGSASTGIENSGLDAQAAVPTQAEENVLHDLHEKAAAHGKGETAVDPQSLQKLHNDMESCECYPLFQKYVSGELPTLKTMFSNLDPLLDEMSKDVAAGSSGGELDEHEKKIQQMQRLIAGREKQVRDSITRYVNSIVRYKHLAKLSAGGTRDMTKQFVDADQARRRAHNNLLDSLSVYAQQIKLTKREGYDSFEKFPFEFWEIGENANEFGADKTPVFSEQVIKNRDFVRDWAIAADFAEQLETLGDNEYLQKIRGRS